MPTLRVAGFSYLNNPAGGGGAEYDANDTGDEQDAVWYQVDRSVIHEAIYGEDIRKAYLPASTRSTLETDGITFNSEDAVRGAGMSHYILWLKGSTK